LFTRFIDTDQIRLVKEAIDAVEAKTFTVRRKRVTNNQRVFMVHLRQALMCT